MHRRFIGLVAAFSILTAGLAAAPARAASDEDIARILAGIIVLGTIAHAVDRNKDTRKVHATPDRSRRHVDRDHRYRDQHRWQRQQARERAREEARREARRQAERDRRHRARALPGDCLRRVKIKGNKVRYLSGRCLRQNDINVRALPNRCRVNYGSFRKGEPTRGFSPRCLKYNGYRIARN